MSTEYLHSLDLLRLNGTCIDRSTNVKRGTKVKHLLVMQLNTSKSKWNPSKRNIHIGIHIYKGSSLNIKRIQMFSSRIELQSKISNAAQR